MKKLYDYRSRLLHGQINIPCLLSYEYDEKPVSSYLNSSYDAEKLAAAVLVASLQQIAKRDWTEVEFVSKTSAVDRAPGQENQL